MAAKNPKPEVDNSDLEALLEECVQCEEKCKEASAPVMQGAADGNATPKGLDPATALLIAQLVRRGIEALLKRFAK